MDWTPPDEPIDEASLRKALDGVRGTAHPEGIRVERLALPGSRRSKPPTDRAADVAHLAPEGDDDR